MTSLSEEPESRSPGRPRHPVARADLLARARETFAELGYAGASMGEIATRAGLRKSSLFHHFPSKDALYREVFALLIEDLSQLVVNAQAVSEVPFLDRLDHLGELCTHYLSDHPQAAQLLLREFIGQGPFFAGQGREGARLALQTIAAFLQSGIDSGEVADQDAPQLALSICGLHLFYFAVPEVACDLLGAPISGAEQTQARVRAIQDQVRRICGAAPMNASGD